MNQLLTPLIRQQLRANNAHPDGDHLPVLKIFNPTGAATWLFVDMDEDGDTLFGLSDLGMGEPELGYASLMEMQRVRVRFGLALERDIHFTTDKPLSAWTAAARRERRIVQP